MWGDAAAEVLALPLDEWRDAVNRCPWFTFDHDSPVRGWVLTDRGRAEALERHKENPA